MSKYIINNCPVAFNTRVDGTYCNDVEITNGKNTHCQYITDCLLKQIVELCKEESSIIQHKEKVKVKGLNKLADKIFELLDIQEVE